MTDGDFVTPARRVLARRLRSREAELQEAAFAHLRVAVPDVTVDGSQHEAGLREMVAACIDCGLESIEQGASWSGPMPAAVIAHVRRGASRGMSLTIALRRCVAVYTLAWTIVLDELDHRELPDEQRLALLLQTSAVMGSVLAGVQAEIAEAHSLEIWRRARSHQQRRDEIVHKLLGGEAVDASELTELRYEFHAWHVGVIVTGADARKTLQYLEARLGCRVLAIARSERLVWAWLAAERRLEFLDLARHLNAMAPLDVIVGVGEPARGLEGWRQTHREAEAALAVGRSRTAGFTRYLDVAPEATALQDDALAESLVERYLLPLDEMRIDGEMARRALRALFDTEHNVSSAAHALNVHRSTLHRWRNEIEGRLGCRLCEHQIDIEIALRVEQLHRTHQYKGAARENGRGGVRHAVAGGRVGT